ncbi:uncharacterized protein A4U43_C04F29560 [Asparagus officinalis]|uniref:Uncharacterized protein n=1 Tax=Asparagus officinalis TaxID=4686 RepID=A0A5P1F7C0_ASPOF|nr:uncharacterized protein A4U43_C04F29560 [Asparagus officinalis]
MVLVQAVCPMTSLLADQHEEELIDKPNKYQELISMSNLNVAQPHVHDPAIILSNGPETPARTDEANGRKFRSESSSLVAEPRVSESVDKYVSNPVRHEYPRIERTAGPHQKLEY